MAKTKPTLTVYIDHSLLQMIASGEMTEAYLEHCLFWKNILILDGYWHSQKCKHFDEIIFRNGYKKSNSAITVECKGICVKDSTEMNDNWCKDKNVGLSGRIFVISLGKVIEIK